MMASNTAKTIKGVSSQSVVTVMMGLLELISFSIMSRLLTKSEFGYYAVIMSITMVFRALAEAGIGSSIIQKKNPDSSFVNTAYTLSFILGIVATIIVILCSKQLSTLIADKSIHKPLMLISFTILPYSLNSVYKGLFLKDLHFMKLGSFQATAFIISQIFAIMLAFFKYGLYSIVIGNILNIFLQNLILRFTSKYKPRFGLSKAHIKSIFSFGGWLTLSRMTGTIYSQIDKILMAKWFSVLELGCFYRTRSLIDTADSQIGGIFDTTLFPILSNIQDEKTTIQNAYSKCMYMGCVCFSLLFVIFFFNAKLIILCFFGEKWLDQILLFRLLSFSMLFYAFSRLADCFIRSLALVRFGFFITLSSCIVLVSCIYFSIGYGTLGVAVVVVSVNLLFSLIKTLYVCVKTDTKFITIIGNSMRGIVGIIPLVVIGVIYLMLYDHTVINSIIFAVIFILVIVIEFAFFPDVIGFIYKYQLYPTIKTFVFSRFVAKK